MTDNEASQWIAAYTPTHVDRDSRVRIELTDRMMSTIDTTRTLDKAFRFTPSLKGRAVYSSDRRYIDFIPEESMKQGRKYECRVDMKAITAVDTLADFAFDFYVDEREARFEDIAVTVDPDNLANMIVRGRVAYSVAAGDSISADSTFVTCDYPGARVVMDRKADKRSRGFKITGIKRQTKEKKLTIAVNPESGFSGAEQKIVVPAMADFQLLNAERREAAEPYIELEFSTPLSSQQELEGLITIDNLTDLRIERSGTNVKVYYPRNGMKEMTLRISDLVKNNEGKALDEEIARLFMQEVIPPAVELPFTGNILPDNRNLKLPFRAVNLAAVDVEVVKIFPANVMSFIQENDLDETYQLRRYGRLIYRRTVRLDSDRSLNLQEWQNFSIDLKDLFARERGAIYNVRLSFRKDYSLYGRSDAGNIKEANGMTDSDKSEWDENDPYIYRQVPDFDFNKYNWDDRDNPSKDTYYMDSGRMPEVNLVASELGLIVKQGGDNEVKASVSNIVTTRPAAGIAVTAYNYQLQKVGSGVTDENGFADFPTEGRPFMVTATDGASTTYLKVARGRELSTSVFDVSGKSITDGIKGFVYGDRGVWRPGDEIHLTLIVEDKERRLPANHPVVMELYSPAGQLYERQVIDKSTDGFYVFHIATEESVRTGLWKAQFKVGNETFHHPVRIETIKPNRLKINIKSPAIIQANSKTPIGLDAQWLTGPAAKGMAASLEMTLYANPTPFEAYRKYAFKNPLIDYTSSQKALYSGTTDSLGHIMRDCTIGADINSPGMLQANITARVTEPGGDASITTKSVPFSPFGVYVGIDLGEKAYETDKDIKLPVVVVNQLGARMKTRELSYKIYRLDWDWWWEGGANDLSRYVQSTTADIVATGTITANNGMAEVPFKVEYPGWGKYLVLVRDSKGGHATGGVITVDWPEWRGRSNKENASGSTELSFNLDKASYEVGETANVYLPKCEGGRVLLSIENGSRVIGRRWVTLSGTSETKYPLTVDKSMAPNFYVTATLLRPHTATDFDTPIRLFGVQSVKVVNPQSLLHPVIEMPDELHPQKPFAIRVSEKDGKPMTYTLAIVDEGLLDITNFRTPAPWLAMNQKEALGVRTWDMFDNVIGAFGSSFRSILSVGGDEALRKAAGKEKRFNPAVKFIGPFTIERGARTHQLTLPNYVGSVRVMVVAAHDGSYGSADKTVKVTSPVMMLSTLPRTLANCDTVEMPVNIFALEEGIRNVAVSIDVDGPVKVAGPTTRNVTFDKVGEKLTSFRLICDDSTEGKARIILTASGNGHVTRDTTFIDVSNPMPMVYESTDRTLKANSKMELSWPANAAGSATLQVSSMPMVNFGGVSLFVESYPHLCSEQLAAKALFMLYGRKFLDEKEREKCDKELPRLIKSLQLRQIASGGFVYWPGQTTENEWVTTMAGIALSEASRQGFRTDGNSLEKWKAYQQNRARDYRYSIDSDLTQAFRLYSLAVAGDPLTSAMNRLRESKQLSQGAAYALASAYAESGRNDVAAKLIERGKRSDPTTSADMFYSPLRNDAIALDACALTDNGREALPIARKIAASCTPTSYVTQEIAFIAIAMNHLSGLAGNGTNRVRITQPGKAPMSIEGWSGVRNIPLSAQGGKVTVENLNNAGSLELSLVSAHRPKADKTVAAYAKGLKMSVRYTDMKGKPINVASLRQDTEFNAIVTIANRGGDVENMALSYAIPSGWEIWNERLHGTAGSDYDSNYDSADLRDSSANFYFPLHKGESKTVRIRLRSVYPGKYILPPTVCEDMYAPSCRAATSNQRVEVK